MILPFFIVLSSFFCSPQKSTYTVEVINGARYIQNHAPAWGDEPKVAIELVRTIGDLDTPDENFQFYLPVDVAEDSKGNIYVLDSGNDRIQKYDPDGGFLSSIGKSGQGPAEFELASILEISADDEIYVVDSGIRRIEVLTTDGSEIRTINWNIGTHSMRLRKSGEKLVSRQYRIRSSTPVLEDFIEPLISVYDSENNPLKGIGEQKIFDTPITHIRGNSFDITTDKNDNIYVTFIWDNRIEKYTSEGDLVFRSERPLNFEIAEPVNHENINGLTADYPNMVSNSIGVDHKERIWVVTLDRQTREDEKVFMTETRRGGGVPTIEVIGNTGIIETDAFKLEVFDSEGILLGAIPLKHFVTKMRIFEDRLYIVDQLRGMQVFQYRIVDK